MKRPIQPDRFSPADQNPARECGAPGPGLAAGVRKGGRARSTRRGTVLLMIVGLLAMLFMLVTAFIMLARFDRRTLQMTAHADRVTQILGSINGVVAGAIRGPRGSDLVTGAQYSDIPGYGGTDTTTGAQWGSPWLASAEPVLDPTTGSTAPADYRTPAVTSLAGGPVTGRRITDLGRDADGVLGVQITPVASGLPPADDTLTNVREPFSDADGDGVLDSFFGGTGLLTELANAMGGRSVRATGIDPSWVPSSTSDPNYPNTLAWQQFDSTARYGVAARIVSHGGMVQVSAPTYLAMWNSTFVQLMFNWVKYPGDPAGLNLNDLQALGAQSSAVEPLLRRRAGLVGDARGGYADGLPPALYSMKVQYGSTFEPWYLPTKTDAWQRFNLASLADWNLWRRAVTIDPNDYYANPIVARNAYVSRQVLTTVNNSDELARIEDPNAVPGFQPGKLKFYLGKITDPVSGAFDVGTGAFNATRGQPIIAELTSYFREMLLAFTNWEGGTKPCEGVKVDDQARMLAVNTVAFAAPRDANGYVDPVYYPDDPVTPTKLYIGYEPQPFFTQIVAYNKTTVQGEPARIALAVELYNPHDSAAAGSSQDLDLTQFAVSISTGPYTGVEKPDGSLDLTLLGQGVLSTLGVTHLAGRSFFLFAVQGGSNDYFHEQQVAGNLPALQGTLPLPVEYLVPGLPPPLEVKLWRGNHAGLWYVVDQMDVDLKTLPMDSEWYVNVRRDTTYEGYLGRWNGTGAEARWRMAVAFPHGDPHYDGHRDEVNGSAPLVVLPELGAGDGTPADPTTSYGPCAPLYTMNASLGTWVLDGAARPASFPTVGFMLFVPRFAHLVENPGTSTVVRRPMGEILFQQWDNRQHSVVAAPADFGHMPIFDNSQPVKNTSSFDVSRTGQVPWGLLVFDYFTTLNPGDANGDGTANDPLDPYRVPGRINVNTASWYVLAGLPLIGHDGAGNLPVDQSASAAFWYGMAGVLTGTGADGTPRYPGDAVVNYPTLIKTPDVSDPWYRLGPVLAQTAAAYRDRVPYVANLALSPFVGVDWQRGLVPYRPPQYGTIRGTGATTKRGFLTVGELANVIGFDSTRSTEWNGDPARTALGKGDFFRSVSLLALLDTHFLTTRSNTFTAYVTLYDRENPQASVRSQMTLDRSNLLPRLIWRDNGNGIPDPPPIDSYTTLQSDGPPELIGERQTSYFGAQYDQ